MALRRLLSGWLIAVAALARSMALVLERAAADRSASAPSSVPGPVMAALAERYPGAPAHWLALVAERTSQLAEAGEAPLSLSSQPDAWSPSLHGPSSAPLMPTAPTADEVAAPGASHPAALSPAVRSPPRPDAVPSLAALQDRPSEVWRRPQASPGRRPRPVFAPVGPVPPRARSASEDTPPVARRSRSPLALDARPPASPPGDGPLFVAPPTEGVDRDTTWSEASTSGAGEPLADIRETNSLAQPKPAGRIEIRASQAQAPFVAPPPSRPWSSEAFASPIARAASAFGSQVNAEPRDVSPPAPIPSITQPDDHASDQLAFSPSSKRPARRSVFRALAALGDRSRAATADHSRAETMPGVSRNARVEIEGDPGVRLPTLHPEFRAPPVAVAVAAAPSARTFGRDEASVHVEPHPAWTEVANDELPRNSRPHFAIDQPRSTPVSASRVVQATDDRWPRFPPGAFAPLVVAEIPSPRLDQLAREQEEGRWSV